MPLHARTGPGRGRLHRRAGARWGMHALSVGGGGAPYPVDCGGGRRRPVVASGSGGAVDRLTIIGGDRA